MTAKKITMSVYGYRLRKTKSTTINLDELLKDIESQAEENKVVVIKGKEIRLENLVNKRDYCFFDFRTRTLDGPNKAKKLEPSMPITLDGDEEFAYHAGGVIDKEANKLAIQFSLKGPKASDMAEYVNSFLGPDQEFSFDPILSHDYEKFMRHAVKLTSFRARLNHEKLDSSLPKKDVGLLGAFDVGLKNSKADLIDITFMVKPSAKNDSKNLFVAKIKKFISKCQEFPDGSVPIMRAKGEYDDGAKFEVELIDGLTIKHKYEILNTKGTPAKEVRYQYLQEAIRSI